MTATVAASLVIVLASALGAWGSAAATTTYSFFANLDVSGVPTDPDFIPIEVGLRFTSSSDGTLTAVRFLKAEGSGNTHPVSVWTAGQRLATATSTTETSSGWQEVRLSTPVTIKAGEVYVVSYHTTRYRVSEDYFTEKATAGPLMTTSGAGVYAYGESSFPTETYRASNYWVDVVFAPAPVAPTTPPTTPTNHHATGDVAATDGHTHGQPAGSPGTEPVPGRLGGRSGLLRQLPGGQR